MSKVKTIGDCQKLHNCNRKENGTIPPEVRCAFYNQHVNDRVGHPACSLGIMNECEWYGVDPRIGFDKCTVICDHYISVIDYLKSKGEDYCYSQDELLALEFRNE